jgi:hypothetical protein
MLVLPGFVVVSSTGLRHRDSPADEGLVISIARSLSPRRASRLLVLAVAIVGSLCLLMSSLASSAGAFVEEVPGSPKVGIQPREVSRYWEGTVKWKGLATSETESNAAAASFNNSSGHTVLHGAINTYAIYWDPQDYYHGDWQGLIDNFLTNLGASNGQLSSVFAVDAQYTDTSNQPAASGSSFHAAYTDTTPYPSSDCVDPHPFELGAPLSSVCLTDAQLRVQLESFINQHNLPRGLGAVYYLLTPPGVAVCLDAGGASGHCSDFKGSIVEVEKAEEKKEEPESYVSYKHSFCSYHDFIGNGNGNTILYAAIPWTAGGAGDTHLGSVDRTAAYPCQDGGFEPTKKVNYEAQEKERHKEPTAQEEEEFNKKSPQEKREQLEAEELGLSGPHEQEPNQLGAKVGPDGAFDHGLADLIINQIGVEQQNVVTDPLLNAWQDPSGSEVTDECRNFFAPHTSGTSTANPWTRAGTLANESLNGANYYLNAAFNMAARRLPYPGIPCLTTVALAPAFTAPNIVNAGEVVGFDGMESDVTLGATTSFPGGGNTYATFTWNFGDGSSVSGFAPGAAPCEAPWLSPCAGSEFHAYTYGGTYQVTLTVKDVAGNVASVTQPVAVEGPPPPSSSSPSSPPATGGSSTGTGSGTTGSGSPGKSAVHPVATAAFVSQSLTSALRGGLVVRYSVNEQVAGRFEVLLASSIARRIGLRGASATGLAKGTPAQIVIAKAILVTTKGGRSTYNIKFSKTTATRLRRLRKVSLMLRLAVHNAASPTVTTVLNTANLAH